MSQLFEKKSPLIRQTMANSQATSMAVSENQVAPIHPTPMVFLLRINRHFRTKPGWIMNYSHSLSWRKTVIIQTAICMMIPLQFPVIPVTNSDMKSKFSNSSSDPSTIKFTMISDKIHDHDAMNYYPIKNWLVVSTPLKNISQWEGLSHILWNIKNVWNHQPGYDNQW